SSREDLIRLQDVLRSMGKGLKDAKVEPEVEEAYTRAKAIAKKVLSSGAGDEVAFDEASVRDFENLGFAARVVFYLLLRARFRHSAAVERAARDWDDAFEYEARRLGAELDELLEL